MHNNHINEQLLTSLKTLHILLKRLKRLIFFFIDIFTINCIENIRKKANIYKWLLAIVFYKGHKKKLSFLTASYLVQSASFINLRNLASKPSVLLI